MTGTARAVVQTAARNLEMREFPLPGIGTEDGLLRVEACGICGSDVETYRGALGRDRPPFVPGHEILGRIEEIGDAAAARWGVQPGDRVAVEILLPCRACHHCLTGGYMSCPNKRSAYGVTPVDVAPHLWGGYADFLYLHPNAILHPVRADLPADLAVMFNPLGAGVRWALHLGQVRLGDTVVVLGSGQRGIAAVIAARAAGASTIITTGLAQDTEKLALAREFGADHTLVVDGPDAVDVVAAVHDLTGGRLADVVLELTPMAHQPIADALRIARHGGRVVLAGLKGRAAVPLVTDEIISKGLTVVGAYSVDARGYAEAIRIIESEQFPLWKLHSATFALEEAEQAIRTLAGETDIAGATHVTISPTAPRRN
ncbi:alcohol dehydrogenase catalytic domain-containing protein [Saccharopolyspora sp. K220]|uniref:zinc-dependent alcohol dehydrogenase n=1 Tax=Saccharopolyspora soli TaxID=2926618 RepID=UPI001F586B0D|nr:alcohol dehydrogenase catalytic domain-containing protein [Saccharopolyspora soli]MCI2416534.1 alcohol dehydrogenase catalytic domain-containing protein [Saccharopolyspora soli]